MKRVLASRLAFIISAVFSLSHSSDLLRLMGFIMDNIKIVCLPSPPPPLGSHNKAPVFSRSENCAPIPSSCEVGRLVRVSLEEARMEATLRVRVSIMVQYM